MIDIWEHRRILERLARLEQAAAQSVVIAGGGSASGPTYVRIIGGNTLSPASIAGIEYSSSNITAAPTATPTGSETGLTSGLGYGRIVSSAGDGAYVWIVNDPRDNADQGHCWPAGAYQVGVSIGTVSLTISGGTTTGHLLRLI